MSTELENFLTPEIKSLVEDGQRLVATIESLAPEQQKFADYSFVVFPFAKAYEGYLKLLFYRAGIIQKYQFESDRWRVGKALNPQLENEFRKDESAYDRLVGYCENGNDLADKFWQVWKKGRNSTFHFFPHRLPATNFTQTKEIINDILAVMEEGIKACPVAQNP